MLKVVEIILDLSKRAGAEVFFASLCEELNSRGDIELSIISLYDNIDSSFSGLRNLRNCKFYTVHKHPGIDFKAAIKLRKIIKMINPDIIHTHRSILSTYFLAFGTKRHKWFNVHTVHSIAEKECNRITYFLRKPFLYKKTLILVGIAPAITSSILKLYPKATVPTILNGISFKHQITDNVEKAYDFICVASFRPVKNHKMLFDVFDSVYEQNSNSNLICLGEGPLFETSKEYIDGLKSKPNIYLVGSVQDVDSYLEKSRTFVLSSLYEGNPISILEAMKHGLPIIAPRVGGIPDIVKDKINGLLYPAGRNDKMYDCMIELLSNTAKYKEIEANNFRDSKNFSMEKCASKYVELFISLIKTSKERS